MFFVGRCHQGERPQSSRTHRDYRHMFLLSGEFIMFICRMYVLYESGHNLETTVLELKIKYIRIHSLL